MLQGHLRHLNLRIRGCEHFEHFGVLIRRSKISKFHLRILEKNRILRISYWLLCILRTWYFVACFAGITWKWSSVRGFASKKNAWSTNLKTYGKCSRKVSHRSLHLISNMCLMSMSNKCLWHPCQTCRQTTMSSSHVKFWVSHSHLRTTREPRPAPALMKTKCRQNLKQTIRRTRIWNYSEIFWNYSKFTFWYNFGRWYCLIKVPQDSGNSHSCF